MCHLRGLLVAGLLVATFDVRVGGVDLLPDSGGAALAAFGAWLLAMGGRGLLRWLPARAPRRDGGARRTRRGDVAPFTTNPAMTVAFALA